LSDQVSVTGAAYQSDDWQACGNAPPTEHMAVGGEASAQASAQKAAPITAVQHMLRQRLIKRAITPPRL